MIGIILDFLFDLFLFLVPVSWISSELRLKPKRLSDLKQVLERLGFRRISAASFAKQAILIFAALAVTGFALSFILSILQMNDLARVVEGIERVRAISPLLLAYFLTVRVLMEEIFFRGFLVNKIGIVASTILFSLLHVFYFSYAEVLGVFLLGLILAVSFKKSQNLFPVVAGHMLYNFFALLFILKVV